MNYWLISDTHFGHTNLDKWGQRSGNWQEQLWAGIASIPDGDTLIHLGDICMGDDEDVHVKLDSVTSHLKSRVLVRGNHDKKSFTWYNKYWDFVCDGLDLVYMGRYLHLTHRPAQPCGNSTWNIHGHTHGKIHHSEEYVSWYSKDYHIDISPELVGFKPLRLDLLLKNYK